MTDTWIGGERIDFPSTRWELVRLAARDAVSMDEVVRIYWKPLYFFTRQKGFDNEAAKDVVQGFLALLIGRKAFAKADPGRGRFRTLLLASLENFIKDRAREAGRAKRKGGRLAASLDFLQGEREYLAGLAGPEAPETRVDRAWAQSLFAECVGKLEASPAHALAFRLRLAGEEISEIARRTGLSEAAVRSAVHRLQGRFRDLLRAHLLSTALRPGEVAGEIEDFIALLR